MSADSNRQPILHVDMTPNGELPMRILDVYLQNSLVMVTGTPGAQSVADRLNRDQRLRVQRLQQAMEALSIGYAELAKQAAGVVKQGRPRTLDKREDRVRRLLRRGLNGRQIARRLRLPESSANLIIRRIRAQKAGVLAKGSKGETG